MKSIRCQDMGVSCDFVAHGKDSWETKAHLMEHAKRVHSDMLGHMSDKEMKEMEGRMNNLLAG